MRKLIPIAAPIVIVVLSLLFPTLPLDAQRRGESSPSMSQLPPGMGGMRTFEERFLPLEYDNRPFDVRVTRLPSYYVGHEPSVLFDRMKAKDRNEPYGTGNPVKSPRPGSSLLPSGEQVTGPVYALRMGAVERAYDGAAEMLTLRCRLSGVIDRGKESEGEKGLSVKYRPLMDNRYTGIGTAGAKVEIEEIRFQEYLVAFRNFMEFPMEKARRGDVSKAFQKNPGLELPWMSPDERLPRESIATTIRLKPKEAKQMADKVTILLIINPIPPYASAESQEEHPALGTYRQVVAEYFYIHARLLELWVYDLESGRILDKIRARKSIRLP